MPLWLNENNVRALLPMRDLIDTMERTLAAFSAGAVAQPVRSVIEVAEHAFYGSMPALIRTPGAMGAKLVTVFGSNTSKGLPTHLATIVLLDPETGALLAVMDGRYITEARTAAVSAVSARVLARPEASVLAIIGSGVQAHSHLEALPMVREFREIRCWSPTRERLNEFVKHNPQVSAAETVPQAVEGADVVALVTASTTPVIRDEWIKPGAHVIGVGACRPTQREIDPALIARSRLIVDSRAAALKESGDVLLAIEEGYFDESHIVAELGQVVAEPAGGRVTADQVTVFKSLGLACEDVAAADLVYRRACESGKGAQLA
ncbi:MAG TPA: ornithine cyclodeaminase family protein [Bryobacteraceae bacterium]|nr:ornithine cyclodeaminase family protein [Bryobacteraceae bacterium]